MAKSRKRHWDVFICHASEDKARVARPLAKALSNLGVSAWYDETSLRIGNSLRREIDKGLSRASYGIVILSKDFFKKEWPQRELDGLVARETDGVELILPIWYRIGKREVQRYSPPLADRLGIRYTGDALSIAAQIALRVSRASQEKAKRPRTALDALSNALAAKDIARTVDAVRAIIDNEKLWNDPSAVMIESLVFLLSDSGSLAPAVALKVCDKHHVSEEFKAPLSDRIRPLLTRSEPALLMHAVRVLRKWRDAHTTSDLLRLVDSPDEALKIQAALALLQCAPGIGRKVAEQIVREGSDDARMKLLSELASEEPSDHLELAKVLAADSRISLQVRTAAVVLVAAATASFHARNSRTRTGAILESMLRVFTPDELSSVLVELCAWFHEGLKELDEGTEIARILLDLDLPPNQVGTVLGALLVLTSDPDALANAPLRIATWERLARASTASVDQCGDYMSYYLYYWSPVWESEAGQVVALLQRHHGLRHWHPFLFNASGDGAAEIAIRLMGNATSFDAMRYFWQNPHRSALPQLTAAVRSDSEYEAQMARYALFRLGEMPLRDFLKSCIGRTGWIVDEPLEWIEAAIRRGELDVKKGEEDLLELVQRKNRV